MYYKNVRGLRTKTVDLYNNVVCENFDIVIFTETWLNCSVYDSELLDPRYVAYRRDRENSGFHSHKEGGGVLIAVSVKFHSTRLSNLESNCEDLWISIDVRNSDSKMEKLFICSVYLPPPIQAHILDHFISNANRVMESNQGMGNTLIVGDFNLSSII